jgi:hypothetical protein
MISAAHNDRFGSVSDGKGGNLHVHNHVKNTNQTCNSCTVALRSSAAGGASINRKNHSTCVSICANETCSDNQLYADVRC